VTPEPAPLGTTRTALARTLRAGAITAVVQYVVTLAVFPVVVHHVGTDLYGAWSAIASLLAVGALADAGIRTEITRRVGAALGMNDPQELKQSLRTGVGILTLTATAVAVVGVLLTPLVREFAFPGGVRGYSPGDLDTVLRATILLLAITLVVDGHLAVLRGVQRSDVENLAVLAGLVPGTALTILLAIGGFGLWALFIGAAAQAVTRWIVQLIALRRLMPDLGFGVTWPGAAALRTYLGLSSLIVLIQASDVIDSQWDKVVLARYVGPASVAFFSIAIVMILQAKTVVVIPLAPIIAAVAELQNRDRAALERTFSLLSRVAAVVGTTLLAGFFAVGPAFIRLWLGAGFDQTGTAIRLFIIAVALNLIPAAVAMRCIALGWHRVAAISATSNIAVNGVLSFVLASTIGFVGPLIGSIAGNAAGAIVLYVLVARRTHSGWIIPRLRAPLVGTVLALLIIVTGLDAPRTWPTFVATTVVLGAMLALGTAFAERLPMRALLGSAISRGASAAP